VSVPPEVVTVTFAVAVTEPAALVAVSVYVVVAVGLTAVEPLADADVNVPGVMAMLVAPVVAQLNVLLAPDAMLVGLAEKDVIVGLLAVVIVIVAVDVTEPAALVAVSVYVVVAVGVTAVEPLPNVDVNVPGVMAMLVAPLVAQLSVLLAPEAMLVGLAANALMVGAEPAAGTEMFEPHPTSPIPASRKSAIAERLSAKQWNLREPNLFPPSEPANLMRSPSLVMDRTIRGRFVSLSAQIRENATWNAPGCCRVPHPFRFFLRLESLY
jgi:hypothetical protein